MANSDDNSAAADPTPQHKEPSAHSDNSLHSLADNEGQAHIPPRQSPVPPDLTPEEQHLLTIMECVRENDLRRCFRDENARGLVRELDPTILGTNGDWSCSSLAEKLPGQFRGYRIRAAITLTNPWAAGANPDNMFADCVRAAWAFCQQRAEEQGIRPLLCLMSLESSSLKDGNMYFCYRVGDWQHNKKKKTVEDPAEEFFKLMALVDQSNRRKNQPTIAESPFILDINVADLKPLANRLLRAGAGRKAAKAFASIRPLSNIYPGAVMDVPQVDDNYCLFRSVILLLKQTLLSDKNLFYKYKMQPNGQMQTDIGTMLAWTDIEPNLPAYSLSEHGPRIQAYLNAHYPNRFRLFGFSSDQHGYRPIFRGDIGQFSTPISLFYSAEEEHFWPLVNPGKIFKQDGKYCFSCERHYKRDAEHKKRCKSKCNKCQRVGPMYPCPEQVGIEIECEKCQKTFTNLACYESHNASYGRKLGQKSVCERNHFCKKCGVCYDLAKQPPQGHICGRTYCRNCGSFHWRNGRCTMHYHPKKEKPKRYILYDFECTTHEKSMLYEARLQHRANFAWATVICTECIADGRWKREFGPHEHCRICGFHRTVAFSSFAIKKGPYAPSLHWPVERDDLIAQAFTRWLLRFEADKFTWLNKGDPRAGLYGPMPKETTAEQPVDAEQLHPGLAEEDELYREYGIHMSPRRGEDQSSEFDEEEEENEDEAMEMQMDDNNEEEGSKQAKKKKPTKPPKVKSYPTYVYAHAGGRYDNIFIFGQIMEQGSLIPKLVRQNNRLLEMRVYKAGLTTNLIFRDSYSLIPLPISKFVDSFGLQIDGIAGKQFFPHQYNRSEHYHLVNKGPPDIKEYGPGTMKPELRKKFLEWHAEERAKGEPWILAEKLVEYCRIDVDILVHGFVAMIGLFRKATSLGGSTLAPAPKVVDTTNSEQNDADPNLRADGEIDRGIDVSNYLTLPSACMAFFLKSVEWDNGRQVNKGMRNRLAITPHMGYDPQQGKSSQIARTYMRWLMHRDEEERQPDEPPLRIQFWDSQEGEKKLCNGQYSVDGYIKRPGNPAGDKAIEIFGCFWHACPRCHPDPDEVLYKDQTAGSIRQRDRERLDQLRPHCEVEVIWEHQITDQLLEDPEMAEFFASQPNVGPLDYSDAFFGGRTGPEVIYQDTREVNAKAKQAGFPNRRRIKMKDFCSQYPFVLYTTRFPIGHPRVKKWEPMRKVCWTRPEHIRDPDFKSVDGGKGSPLEGIIKCWIVPPIAPKYGVPVVPYKCQKRLLFPLCRTCAEKHPDGLFKPDYVCPHGDRENMDAYEAKRGWMATITTLELEMALEANYTVTKLHSAYLWEKSEDWSSHLFHPYIERMYKIKLESSGWPPECTDPMVSEEEREMRKLQFMDKASQFGVQIDPENMILNPGMRLIAKFCLNSLWGRFALRAKLPRTRVIDDSAELAELLDNPQVDLEMLEQMRPGVWLVSYTSKDQYVMEHGAHNPIIALWTTSAARCHLLKHMQGIQFDMAWEEEQKRAPGFHNRRFQPIRRRDTQLLYYDTDSLTYSYDERYDDPLPTGDQLGELTEEYPGWRIVAIYSTGPKSYMLVLERMVDGKLERRYVIKLRSITLDHETTEYLEQGDRYMEMSREVAAGQHDGLTVKKNLNFVVDRNRQGICTALNSKKTIKPSIKKLVQLGKRLVPFGYQPCPKCKQEYGLDRHCLCDERGPDRYPDMCPSVKDAYLPADPEDFDHFVEKKRMKMS